MRATEMRTRRIVGAIVFGVGLLILAIAGGVIGERSPQDAPPLVIALAGIVFLSGGVMLALGQQSRITAYLAVVILLAFAGVAAWAAFFAAPEGFSGGLPFVPRELNVSLGRVVFAIAAVFLLGLAVAAAYRAFRRDL